MENEEDKKVEEVTPTISPTENAAPADGTDTGLDVSELITSEKEAVRDLMHSLVDAPPPDVEQLPHDEFRCHRLVWFKDEHVRCKNHVLEGKKYCSDHNVNGRTLFADKRSMKKLGSAYKRNVREVKEGKELDLSHELLLSRSLADFLHDQMTHFRDDKGRADPTRADANQLNVIRRLTDALDASSKIAERLHRIRLGEKSRVDIATVRDLVGKVVEIIKKHVLDDTTLRFIAEDLQKLVMEHDKK